MSANSSHINGTRPIVLIGMMGSGKTSIGEILSKEMGYGFIDSDREIEKRSGLQISHIFEDFGEEKFREFESKTVLDLIKRPETIIATGGGAVMTPAIAAAVFSECLSVYIDVEVDLLWDRLSGRINRPLLLMADDPQQKLKELLQERNPVYRRADLCVRVDDNDEKPFVTAQKILDSVRAQQQ